jgi:hypothetical protein
MSANASSVSRVRTDGAREAQALFCGLPRLEKRLAAFVSASDESDSGHHRSRFWHGGGVAPGKDLVTYFPPAWQERVLDAEPSIPFLHTTDMRDPAR